MGVRFETINKGITYYFVLPRHRKAGSKGGEMNKQDLEFMILEAERALAGLAPPTEYPPWYYRQKLQELTDKENGGVNEKH